MFIVTYPGGSNIYNAKTSQLDLKKSDFFSVLIFIVFT